MKNLFVCAALFALHIGMALAASPRTYYNGGIETGFPQANSLSGGAWSWDGEKSEATFSDGKVEIDADYESSVDFSISSAFSLKHGSVSSIVEIEPGIMSGDAAITNVPDCKTGFQVRNDGNSTNYYCIASVGGVRKWVRLEGATYRGGFIRIEMSVSMSEGGAGTARFTITPEGGSSQTLTYLGSGDIPIVIDDERVRGIGFCGSGRLSEMNGTKTVTGGMTISPLFLHQR